MAGFEPTASTSQMWRATNCATPRYSLLLFFTAARGALPVAMCRAAAALARPCIARMAAQHFRLAVSAAGGARLRAPTALHPDIPFFCFLQPRVARFRLPCVALRRPWRGLASLAWLPSTSASLFPPLAALGCVHQLRYTPVFPSSVFLQLRAALSSRPCARAAPQVFVRRGGYAHMAHEALHALFIIGKKQPRVKQNA